jgi:RimJ/RimL family protein N-acetyltransferase
MSKIELTTARLRLEPLDDRHLHDFNAMNRDPDVGRFLYPHAPETLEQAKAGIERVKARWAEWGRYGWWAFMDRQTGELVGAGCLQHLGKDATRPHEIGWRLRRDRWGQGLAIEAAREIVRYAFEDVGAPCVYAVANPGNAASVALMRKLGMRDVGLEEHDGETCTTWRLDRADWRAQG